MPDTPAIEQSAPPELGPDFYLSDAPSDDQAVTLDSVFGPRESKPDQAGEDTQPQPEQPTEIPAETQPPEGLPAAETTSAEELVEIEGYQVPKAIAEKLEAKTRDHEAAVRKMHEATQELAQFKAPKAEPQTEPVKAPPTPDPQAAIQFESLKKKFNEDFYDRIATHEGEGVADMLLDMQQGVVAHAMAQLRDEIRAELKAEIQAQVSPVVRVVQQSGLINTAFENQVAGELQALQVRNPALAFADARTIAGELQRLAKEAGVPAGGDWRPYLMEAALLHAGPAQAPAPAPTPQPSPVRRPAPAINGNLNPATSPAPNAQPKVIPRQRTLISAADYLT